MKIRLRPSQSMRWMMNDINIFSSAHIHSRPQSPSFPGRLQIKPSGTGDENGSPLNHKRAFSKTLHHGDCFQKMRFWCPKNLRNIYRYAWTRPGGDQGSNFRTKKRTQKWQENSANLERKRGGTKGWVHSFLAAESRKQGFGKLTCSHSSRGSAETIQHSHANKATKLSILLRFYFHGVLEQFKTNFQTNFRFKRVLTWRPRELSCRLKKLLISGNFAI